MTLQCMPCCQPRRHGGPAGVSDRYMPQDIASAGAGRSSRKMFSRQDLPGCADALVGGADGVQFLDFDRDAASLDTRARSATPAVAEHMARVRAIH